MPAWPSDPNPWANDPFASESSYGVWNDGNPSNPLPWSFWQYNSPDVYIPGIGGASGITHNDIDVAHGDVNFVKGFLIQGAIWDGSASNAWGTSSNWNTDAVPTGTTEVLFDVGSTGISGRKAERVLDEVGISTNRNTIPGETRSAFQTSGLRIGTPAVTTRGFKEADVVSVANMISRVLRAPEDQAVLESVRKDVKELTAGFPVPGLSR